MSVYWLAAMTDEPQRWRPQLVARRQRLAALAAAIWLLPCAHAFADHPPPPAESVVGPMVLLVDLFAFLPFTGLFLLAYFVVLLRKSRIRGLSALAVGHVIIGALISGENMNLGVMQIVGGIVLLGLDRLVARAVHRLRRQMMASKSSFSMPSMAPITTTASRHNMPAQTDSSDSRS